MCSRVLTFGVANDTSAVVSYLFRSMGSVLGISIGSTLVQNTLRKHLHERLTGEDVDIDDVSPISSVLQETRS